MSADYRFMVWRANVDFECIALCNSEEEADRICTDHLERDRHFRRSDVSKLFTPAAVPPAPAIYFIVGPIPIRIRA